MRRLSAALALDPSAQPGKLFLENGNWAKTGVVAWANLRRRSFPEELVAEMTAAPAAGFRKREREDEC